jgi:hypothetical protein
MSKTSELPTAGEMIDTVTDLLSGFAIGALVFPGFLLCVPGILLALSLAAIPVIAVGLLGLFVAVAAGLVTAPYFAVRWLLRRRPSVRHTEHPVQSQSQLTRRASNLPQVATVQTGASLRDVLH